MVRSDLLQQVHRITNVDKKSILGKVSLTKKWELSVFFCLGKKLGALPNKSQLFFLVQLQLWQKKTVETSWLCIGDLYLDDLTLMNICWRNVPQKTWRNELGGEV